MEYVDWGEELRRSKEHIQEMRGSLHDPDLHQPVSTIIESQLCVLSSSVNLRDALHLIERKESEFALVQDSPNTMCGVLRRSAMHAALVAVGDDFDRIPVSNVMDRKICVEPDTATIAEVMDRMLVGSCGCTVVVDSRGRPFSIVSPKTILTALKRIYPSEIESVSKRH